MVMQTVTISQWGNSCAIRLDKTLLAQLGVQKGALLSTKMENGSLVLTPVRKEVRASDLDRLFEGYHGEYRGEEFGTGAPVGREII